MSEASRPVIAADEIARLTLRFRDSAKEARYRAATRELNLRQARLALVVAMLINLPFAAMGPFVFQAYQIEIMIAQGVGMTAYTALLLVLTYLPYFRTRWPLLMVALVLGFTEFYAAINVIGVGPPLVIGGFILLLMGVYVLVPLIFMYGAVCAELATVFYLASVWWGGTLTDVELVSLTLQLISANVIGVIMLYRRELFQRRDFASDEIIENERRRYHELLISILPASVADRLQRGERVVDDVADSTVLFADIVGFTQIAAAHPPEEVLGLLDRVFAAFDRLVESHGLEKIKTIGDAYMVAGGVAQAHDRHDTAIADLALDMRDMVAGMTAPDGNRLGVRIGIHTGPLIAGVIGETRFLYDLWGDTVNTASRMEAAGEAGSIQVSDAVRDRLAHAYDFAARGDIEVKGKGRMRTWYLLGRRNDVAAAE